MNGETRLERLLRRETDTYRPAADGFERIRARMRVRRRQKVARRAGAGMLAVAVVAAAVVVATTGGHRPNGRQTTVAIGGGPSSTAAQGPGVLVSVTQRRVEWLSPTDGHVLQALTLAHPLASSPVGQVAASPSGSSIYVAVGPGNGSERTIATQASTPAVNASGTELAYLTGGGPQCVPTTVTVQQLTGAETRRSWRISPSGKAHHANEQLLSLSWAPNGHDLLVGSEFGPYSGVQRLDTRHPVDSQNPVTIGLQSGGHQPAGRYAYPVEESNGRVIVSAPNCWGSMRCPYPASQMGTVDTLPASGRQGLPVAGTPKRAVAGLVLNPAGDEVLAEVRTNGSGRPYKLLLLGPFGTRTLAAGSGPVAWVTGAVPTSPTPPTTQAAQVVATLHLSSHTIRPGGKLRATITVDNRTGHALHDSGCGTLFEVVLGNAAHPNVPAQLTCIRGYTIRPGVSTYHPHALTTYATCEVNGSPRCGRTSPPPLPPGEYRAKVYEQGHAVPVPAAQEVRVRAR